MQRPRFLAITEFGPRSIIYHEGARYLVNKVILPIPQPGEEDSAADRAREAVRPLRLPARDRAGRRPRPVRPLRQPRSSIR